MERKTARDFPQELLDILDLYVHGDIDRREFLHRAQRFATGTMTAAMLLEALRPNYAWAQQVAKDDPRIKTETVTVDSPQGNGKIRGVLAWPAKAAGTLPAVLVIHENRGLNPYIEDVGRRAAAAGFLSFAPDGLTSAGGYPGNDEAGVKAFAALDRAKVAEDFLAAAKWLKAHSRSNGRLGAVGFCFGGGVVNNLAVRLGADLNAGVPFYGSQPKAEDVAKIKAPLMIMYASLDKRINDGWPAFEEALKANRVTHRMHMYEGTNHGFHNDTTPRYDEKAAKLAWSRTVEFFEQHLK
jgi:carboxymethylenebutenolidase